MCHYINRFQYWIVYTCAYRIYSLIGYVLPKRIVPTPKTVGLDSNWPQMNRKRISLPEMLALHIQQDDYQFVCCDRSPDRRIVRYPSYPRLYLARSTTSPTRAQNSVGQTMGCHSSLRNFDIREAAQHKQQTIRRQHKIVSLKQKHETKSESLIQRQGDLTNTNPRRLKRPICRI